MNSGALQAVLVGGRATVVPVARSLGRAGIPVHALGAPTDPIRYSRYCRSYVEFEDDAGFQAGCLESLLGQSDGGVIMPFFHVLCQSRGRMSG